MVSAAKAFANEPPREPLTNLRAIVEDFKWRYVDRKKTDQVIEFCRLAPDFPTAVRRAVEARDEAGKHHNHQSKVDITARRTLGEILIAEKRSMLITVKLAKDGEEEYYTPFDAMHDYIDEVKPYGIGPVTVYDVAVRIGAFLEVEPKQVYMHAGVRQGLKALAEALSRTMPLKKYDGSLNAAHKLDRVPMYMFPKPLRRLKADDVEDILCTYREVFETW